MQDKYLTVEITKTVPVADYETLEAFLNQELEKHIGKDLRDGGASKRTAGAKALDLIMEAGFTLTNPVVLRDPPFIGGAIYNSQDSIND